jgi:phage-related protein
VGVMATVGRVEVKVDLDTAGISRGVAQTKREIKSLQKSFRGLGNALNRTTQNVEGARAALLGFSALAGPLGGVLAGVGGALAASFSAAGVAIAGAGAVAISVLNDVFDASEELENINKQIQEAKMAGDMKKVNELLRERKQLMSGLSSEQIKATNALNDFKSFWSDFASSFETPVVNIFTQSLGVLKNSLEALRPAIEAGFTGISRLMDGFARYTESQGFKEFIDWVGSRAATSIQNLGIIGGNVIIGLLNLFKAFDPLMGSVENGLVGLTERFRQWSETVGQSQGFQNFVNFVKENGPKVLQLLGQISEFLIRLGIVITPLGLLMMDVATGFFEWANSMMTAHPIISGIVAGIFQLGGLVALVVPRIASLVNVVKTLVPAFMAVGRALIAFATTPIGAVIVAVGILAALIIANWDKIKAWTIKAWNAASQAVSQAWSKIKSYVSQGVQNAVQAVQNGVSRVRSTIGQWASAGRDLIMGLVNGIKSMAGRVASAALSVAKGAINKVKGFLGIHSPAKMTIDMGQDFGAGFAIGIGDMLRDVQVSAMSLARGSLYQLETATPSVARQPVQNNTRNYEVIVNNYGRDLDGRDIAEAIRRREWLDA